MEALARPTRPESVFDGGAWRPLAGPGWAGRVRAVRRGVLVALVTLAAAPVQAAMLGLKGRGKVVVARLYWAWVCRVMGLRVRVIGRPVAGAGVVFVSNHSSWLDIPVLGGVLPACFVSKAEVGRWPVVRTIARLGRTVFVTRRARDTLRERDGMQARLRDGDSLVLFPEGTSSDGSRVLPFHSSFFAVVEGASAPIQPVSVVYDQLAGLPMGRVNRPVFAWYGDMELGSHFWQLAQQQGLRATVLLHPPIDPATIGPRKAVAQAVWDRVAAGAATLRQNRPAASWQG